MRTVDVDEATQESTFGERVGSILRRITAFPRVQSHPPNIIVFSFCLFYRGGPDFDWGPLEAVVARSTTPLVILVFDVQEVIGMLNASTFSWQVLPQKTPTCHAFVASHGHALKGLPYLNDTRHGEAIFEVVPDCLVKRECTRNTEKHV